MKNSNLKKLTVVAMLVLSLGIFAGCATVTPAATETATALPVAATSTQAAVTDTATAAPEATAASTAAVAPTATVAATDVAKVFTAAELAKYDGKNGNPAYVAVDGTVYDVSSIPQWSNGSHAGGSLQAGADQSEAIKQSPHGKRVLETLPVMGTYQ